MTNEQQGYNRLTERIESQSRPTTRFGYAVISGPYVACAGLLTYLFSKEIWVMEHEFTEFTAVVMVAYGATKLYGDRIAKYLDGVSEVCFKLRLDCLTPN